MATCEVYATNRKAPSPEQEIAILELKAKIPAAKQAGLTTQAEHLEGELAIRRLGLVPLGREELQLWHAWFPTAYRAEYLRCGCGRVRLKPLTGWGRQSVEVYNFDRVPKRVLELIARIRDEYKLDWIEIRTPEQARSQDPGLFGGKGNATALFARWGESDERLISFEEIRAGLTARGNALAWGGVAGGACVIAAFSAVLGFLFGLSPDSDLKSAITCWSIAAAGLSAAAVGFWMRSKVQRVFAYAFR